MSQAGWSWPGIGNDKVTEFLEKAYSSGQVAQAYIFVGLDDLGKSTVALAFARNLQGQPEGFNSDLHILEPEAGKKSISIELTREFIKTLNLSSFLNSYKIGIIKEAELLTEEAKSALLKTLEEPKEKVVIILLVSDESRLPATILSRAQLVYFYPVPAAVIYDYLIDNYGANRSLAKDLANLALGRPLLALKMLENPEEYRDYLDRAEKWLSIIGLDHNSRLKVLDELFSDKTWSKQAVEAAANLLFMAEGLARDLLLLHLGQPERLQNSALLSSLEKTLAILDEPKGEDSAPVILRQLKLIAQAKEYLTANVNPRLILEQVVINY